MVFKREAWRNQPGEIPRARLDFEDPLAVPALKVVMMMDVGELEARVFAGQIHAAQLPLFNQGSQVAVHRCQAKFRNKPLGSHENFLR